MPALILLDGLIKLKNFKKLNIGLICQLGIQIVFNGLSTPTEYSFVLSPRTVSPNDMINFMARKETLKTQIKLLLEFCNKYNITLINSHETQITGIGVYEFIKKEWEL